MKVENTQNENSKIKIDIISGFLGAGKTTLIKKLLVDGYPDDKVVLVENEFGEVNIDSQFLSESGIEIREISSGCICCSLKMEFAQGLKEIVERYAPTRILIEPTGVAKIGDVEKAIATAQMANLELETIATVVSAECVLGYLEGYGEFYEEQIVKANCLLLSQQDDSSEEEILEICDVLHGINKNAPIITTAWDELSSAEIVAAIHGTNPRKTIVAKLKSEQVAEKKAEIQFQSCSFETTKKVSIEQLENFLKHLKSPIYGKILRGKGVVLGVDGWLHFDFTEFKSEIRQGAAGITGIICLIGTDLDKPLIKKLFEKLA